MFLSRAEHRRAHSLSSGFAPILLILAVALIAIPVTTYLIKQETSTQQHASEPGCPLYPPEGGQNACVPMSFFSQCPVGSYNYASSDSKGDSDCSTANNEPSMCCYTPPHSSSVPATPVTPLQTCDQKYGSGYQCLITSATECQSGTQQNNAGTTCVDSDGFSFACCKAATPQPPTEPTVLGANIVSCYNNQVTLAFNANGSFGATSYNLIYGIGGYNIAQKKVPSSTSNFTVSGLNPNSSVFYNVEACNNIGCTIDHNGYFGPVSTGSSCSLQTCSQKYGSGYQCLTTFATECQSGTQQSTVGTDCTDSTGFSVACCKAAPPTPTPTTKVTYPSCSQKYGSGYQCLTTFASECTGGTQQSTVGTDCSDTTGFQVACCKAAPPTATPTPTPKVIYPSCAQKYGTGYQCLTTFATECQTGIQQSTAGTDCTDTTGFQVACCKAAPPTPTPTLKPNVIASTQTCSQKYGSGYSCYSFAGTSLPSECQSGTQQSTAGTDCSDPAGFNSACCKAAPPTPTPTLKPNVIASTQTCSQKYGTEYQCMSTFATECTSGTQQSTAGTDCSDTTGFQVACCKAAAPSCSQKYGTGYQCLLASSSECSSGTQQSPTDTSCSDSAGFSFSCCKPPPPVDCSSKGGRCINGLSQSCSDNEDVYTAGITSCSTTSQICCVPKPVVPGASGPSTKQYLYFKSEGWTCVDNVIFNLSAGDAKYDPTQKYTFIDQPRIDPNAIDCKAQGKECKLVGAGTLETYTCLDNSTPDKTHVDETAHATEHCGTGTDSNKIFGVGGVNSSEIDPLGPSTSILSYNAFRRDCAAEGKICTQVGQVAICNDRPLDNVVVHPPSRQDDPTSGVNQGNNTNNYVDMIASNDGWYQKGLYLCSTNKIVVQFGKVIEDCEKENKVCTEIDQKVKCASPIVVDNTTINHLYCGDGTNVPMPFSLKQLITDTASKYILDKTGISDIQALSGGPTVKLNAASDLAQYGYVKLVGSDLEEQLVAKGVSEIIAKQTAEHIFGPVTFLISPGDVALAYSALKTFVSSGLGGVKYDYWTCNGDKIEKRRIDVGNGVASSEFRDCPDKGTACKIFDDRCVVCAKKENTAFSSVQGAQIAQSCPLKSQGDANCDGKVDNTDLLIWRSEKLNNTGKTADFNSDGKVSLEDLDNYIPIK